MNKLNHKTLCILFVYIIYIYIKIFLFSHCLQANAGILSKFKSLLCFLKQPSSWDVTTCFNDNQIIISFKLCAWTLTSKLQFYGTYFKLQLPTVLLSPPHAAASRNTGVSLFPYILPFVYMKDRCRTGRVSSCSCSAREVLSRICGLFNDSVPATKLMCCWLNEVLRVVFSRKINTDTKCFLWDATVENSDKDIDGTKFGL